MSDEVQAKRPNRKRKKTFLKNARKYAKKGRFGRGSQLDSDLYQYFIRAMETFRAGLDDESSKSALVNNALDQTIDQEIDIACNQVGCRVMEVFLPYSNDDTLKRYLKVFGADLRPLISDNFASHVLQALVKVAYQRREDHSECRDFLIKISKFLLNNLEDYIGDTYGSHVMRTCLENLAESDCNELTEIIKDYAMRLIVWPQFAELCHSDLTSGFLQVLLKCLHKIDGKLVKKYLKKLQEEVFQSESNVGLPQPFLSMSVLMLVETSLQISTPKVFKKMYRQLFAENLPKLCQTPRTKFAVQKLIQYCNDKEIFEEIVDKTLECFKDIVELGHIEIILALAQACKRLSTKQGNFVQSLMKAFDCFEPEERQNSFILCLCRLKRYEDNEKVSNDNLEKENLNLHGTLIVQTLLDFNKPIKIVNAILNLDLESLTNLFCNTKGSHIVDSFMKAQFVGQKSVEKLVRKMSGSYQTLASTKYGSRSFEALWQHASLKCKTKIMDELVVKDAIWSNSQFGKIIASKVNLGVYKRNKENWRVSLQNKENNKEEKREKMLEEILK